MDAARPRARLFQSAGRGVRGSISDQEMNACSTGIAATWPRVAASRALASSCSRTFNLLLDLLVLGDENQKTL